MLFHDWLIRMPERIVTVLQAKLADEIAAVGDAGLRLDPPSEYYLPGARLEYQEMSAPCVVVVEQLREGVSGEGQSGDDETHTQTLEVPINVRVIFRFSAWEPLERTGRPQTQHEVVWHTAARYLGALANTLHKWGPDGQTINTIRLTKWITSVLDDQGGQSGQAAAQFTVRCEVEQHNDIRISGGAPV